MTDAQERAKAVAEQVEELRVMDHEGTTLNKREIEAMLADQLAQVEAETWEQATKIAMMWACDRCFHESCDVQRTMAKNCHQQAQRAKVEDGTK